jgi:hypothetical protein
MILFRRMNIFRNHKADQHHDRKSNDKQDNEPVPGFDGHADNFEPALNRAAAKSQFATFHHAAI